MRTLELNDPSVKVCGLPVFRQNGKLERVPAEVRSAVPSISFFGRRPPGGRILFRTDSGKVKLTIEFETLGCDVGMALYHCQRADIFFGDRRNALLGGFLCPMNYEMKRISGTYEKESVMQDVTIFLPRNEVIKELIIELDDGAVAEPPTPYSYGTPVIFYGSSITEGGHTSRPSNAYPSIISKRLDTDFINLGFSGTAKGEIEIADYILTLEKSVLVMDYDHNAPDPEHLQRTHEPFFRHIREKEPELPVIFVSRPDFDYSPEISKKRRDIIRRTYEKAIGDGDRNVRFIDGETLFGDTDRDMCIGDGVHPNDLGHYRMANVIEPVIRKILERKKGTSL